MATTKFSVITTGDKPTFHVLVKELPGEYTYKMATEIAKAIVPTDEEIIAVIETWKLYPKKNEKTEKKNKMDDTKQGI